MLDELKIKRADNGFIITYKDEGVIEEYKLTTTLFEIKKMEYCKEYYKCQDLECYQDILYFILYWLGYMSEDTDEKTLVIEIKNNKEKYE